MQDLLFNVFHKFVASNLCIRSWCVICGINLPRNSLAFVRIVVLARFFLALGLFFAEREVVPIELCESGCFILRRVRVLLKFLCLSFFLIFLLRVLGSLFSVGFVILRCCWELRKCRKSSCSAWEQSLEGLWHPPVDLNILEVVSWRSPGTTQGHRSVGIHLTNARYGSAHTRNVLLLLDHFDLSALIDDGQHEQKVMLNGKPKKQLARVLRHANLEAVLLQPLSQTA
mmetsp:Transcript_15295/g.29653  ORF Transcript_15295/g.29653 Transcript_15295/m.29653 type:complete len:228 (-) Transcript_15295:939-1622(-)